MDIDKEAVMMALILLLCLIYILSPYNMITVESGSMEPEIESISDVAIIDTSDSDPDIGDIIVYDSATLDRKVTHRVVEETPDGYITKGDNNVMTDQEAGEPPVDKRRIDAVLPKMGESPIIIPSIGHLSILFTTYRELILTLLVMSFVFDYMSVSEDNSDVKRSLKILSVTCLALVLIWSSFVLLSLESSEHRIIEVKEGANPQDPNEIEVGEEIIRTIELTDSTHVYPTQEVVEILDDRREITGDTELIDKNEKGDGTTEYTFRNPPIEEEGLYVIRSVKHVYPKTLPGDVIIYLHNIHPLIASLSTVSVVGIVPILLSVLALFFARKYQKYRTERSESEGGTNEGE